MQHHIRIPFGAAADIRLKLVAAASQEGGIAFALPASRAFEVAPEHAALEGRLVLDGLAVPCIPSTVLDISNVVEQVSNTIRGIAPQ